VSTVIAVRRIGRFIEAKY